MYWTKWDILACKWIKLDRTALVRRLQKTLPCHGDVKKLKKASSKESHGKQNNKCKCNNFCCILQHLKYLDCFCFFGYILMFFGKKTTDHIQFKE